MARSATLSGFCVLVFLMASAAESGAEENQIAQIQWQEDAREAIRQAREGKRPLLVYVTAANCLHCRDMERGTWVNANVAQAVQRSYVPLKLTAEKNAKLVEQLNVQAFPTTILFTAQIKIHDAAVGSLSVEELTQMLSRGPVTVARQPVARN